MSPDREQQRNEILETALSLHPASRLEFVERACASDSELCIEIERLIGVHNDLATDFLGQPAEIAQGLETTASALPDDFYAEARHGRLYEQAAADREAPRFPCGDSIQRDIEADGRFKCIHQIGFGSFGIVYEAYDFKRGETIALKVLRDIEPHLLYRFKQEFRLIQKVGHPHLLRVFELIQHETSIFFTMERILGIDFIEYIRGPSHTHFDESRLRSALFQLATATHALHSAKLIHRDIKPSNILVDSSGHLTLLDFGLIKLFGPDGGRRTIVAGTPNYMAPEQAYGGTLTEAADWYAVGAVLYEALSGKTPHEELPSAIGQKEGQEVIPAAAMDCRVPEDLNDLCVNLLRSDPAARPSGVEVVARLSAVPVSKVTVPIATRDAFIGRTDILEELATLVRTSAAGSLAIATIFGRSGIGKTALLDGFAREITGSHPGTILLRGRCFENEFIPFKSVDDLVDQLSRKLLEMPSTAVSGLLPRESNYLVRVFPVLAQVESIRRRVEKELLDLGNPQELRRRGFAALTELLARLSALSPLVAIIDDLQWGDLDTISLFQQLVTGPAPPRMLLVCSFRSESVDANPFVPAFRKVLEQASTTVIRNFELSELSQEESLRLASHLLNQNETRAIAEAIANDAGGNPLFIAQFAAALNSVASSDVMRETARVLSFSSLIRQRISVLSGVARRLLELLATAGSPMPEPLLLSLLGKDLGGGTSELHRLISDQLVRRVSTAISQQVDIYHSRIRESILEVVPEHHRRYLHRELAEALEREANSDPAFVSHHFQMAEMNDRAVSYAIAAGDKAAHGLAFDRAARCYLSCLQLLPPGTEERRNVTLKLADVLVNAGRGIEAATYYLEAVERSPAELAVQLKRRAADQLLRSGDIAKGEAILRSIGERFSLSVKPSLSLTVLRTVIARLLIQVRGLKYRERPDSEIDPKALACLETYWSMAISLAMFSPIVATSLQFRHLLLTLRTGARRHLALALASEAAQLTTGGPAGLPRAEQVLAAAFEIAARTKDDYLLGFASTMSALVSWLAGNWRRTAEQAEAAERMLVERCTGVAWELGTVRFLNIGALIWMGEWKRLASLLSSYIRDAEQRVDLYTTANLQLQQWITHLAADDAAGAHHTLNQAERTLEGRWTPRGFHLTHLWGLMGRVHILLYEARGREASALMESEWAGLSRSFLLRVQMLRVWVEYFRAACAIAASVESRRRVELLSIATASATRLGRTGAPCAKALALLLNGMLSAVQGRKESAIQSFEEAEVSLSALDMFMFATAGRYAHALLVGGTKGQQLKSDIEATMLSRGVLRPDRVAQMICPIPT